MTSREAFEAWWKSLPQKLQIDAESIWQAAWEARGRHDAEVCRKQDVGSVDGLQFGEICAKAIEGQG